jgi:hypothetical protein
MTRGCDATSVLAAVWLSLGLIDVAAAQTRFPSPGPDHKEAVVTTRARGTFEVKLTPQPPAADAEDSTVGRLLIDKRFHGDLDGTSRGQMLTAMTGEESSAGYVAIELVRGTLQGRTGTFMLQHSGTMARGARHLNVSVVPDSGTGELVGLAGQMSITIADGKHSYELEYTLPAAP